MYSCGLCNCTFETEKESYEHDISDKHHRKFEESEKFYGRQARHFCSICNCGNIQGIVCWFNHTRGARHRNSLASLHEYYEEKGPDVNVESSTQSSRNGFKSVQKHAPGSSNSQTYSGKRSSHDVHQSSSSSDIKRDKFSSPMQPTKKSKVINTSDVQEGGMMLNILETIHKDSPTPRKNGKQAQKINTVSPKTKYSNVSKQSAGTSNSKQNNMCTPVKIKTVKNKRIPECCEVTSHPITPKKRSEVSSKAEETSKSEELLCMEKALIISQELQSLKIKQDELEEKLRNTEAELNLVRSKRRELKQQRSSLLRGLNHSDSDAESHADSSRSEVTDTRQTVALPIQRPSVKAVASIAPLDTLMNTIQSSDDSTYKSKTTNKQSVDEPLPSTSYATVNRRQYDFEQQQQQQQHQYQQHQRNIPTSSPVAPETTFNIPSTSRIPNIPPPIQPQQPISDPHNSVPVNSTSNAVDLERLALIRQALQSPDSWQFTFDEVDQMLKQAAAKASANSVSHRTAEVLQQPPTQITSSTDLSNSSKDTITSIPIKTEPIVHITPEVNNEQLEQLSKNHNTVITPRDVSSAPTPSYLPQITSVHSVQPPPSSETIKTNHSSSSSFTSSDDETPDKRTASDKSQISYSLKMPTETDTNYTSSQTDTKLPCYSGMMSSSSSKGGIKIGEFHAFDGCTSAVIDMVVHPNTQVAYIGGQNGTIVECDLKTHQCITRLPLRDASITRLCLDPKGESIYVGYYDQYFADYSLSTGLLVHKNFFSSRIEAMAAAPSPDIPFIFLGLFGGDILRYNFKTNAIGFLCRHTSSHRQSESIVGKTDDDVEQTTDISQSSEPAGVTSLCLVQSGTSLLLIIGGLDRSISIVSASNGNLISSIQCSKQKGPPQGISSLPIGSFFSSFSDRSIRIYNWKTGAAELSFHVHKISSSCIMHRYIAVGDSEGAVRVYKFQSNGLPQTRPIKVYFISARGAVTSLVCVGDSLIAGSLDGSVTVILVNEPASDYTCLYGRKCGENCGLGFMDRRDLLHHVLNQHLQFGNKKTIMCGWGSGRCRVRFTETQTIRSISDHLLTHIPD
ncbi:unnamed protein product [Trichobilharzia szidati]|nr:unnamed protein product [Trichobilharzia szidati]